MGLSITQGKAIYTEREKSREGRIVSFILSSFAYLYGKGRGD